MVERQRALKLLGVIVVVVVVVVVVVYAFISV
jgi:hypothetical protein